MPSELEAIRERYILHWGEMGALWGVNRTVAQVHALLFISPEPLSANDIVAQLGISRGNASMALRELAGWGLVQRAHVRGERKEFYSTEKDVWELFRVILRERKKREVDPTIEVLRDAVARLNALPAKEGRFEREQLGRMLEFFETGAAVYGKLESESPRSLLRLVGYAARLKWLKG